MKKIIIIVMLISFGLVCTALYVSVFYGPCFVYAKIILSGIESDYLNLKPPSYEYLKPDEKLSNIKPISLNDKLFKKFLFGNYHIVVPIHNPIFKFVPIIGEYDYSNQPLLGFKLVASKYQSINVSFLPLKRKRVTFNLYHEKLFSLSVIKKIIFKRSNFEIWRDLHRKDLTYGLDTRLVRSSYTMAKMLMNKGIDSSFEELCYNLYILYLRQNYFSSKRSKYNWYDKGSFGIVDLTDPVSLYKKEIFYLKDGDYIYPFELVTRKDNKVANRFKLMLLNNIRLDLSSEDISKDIYLDYRNLSYDRRIDQEGMIYLYMAWSHVRKNKNFLRQMIQLLEKGRDNLIHIEPLYEYAFQRYGTNFSKIVKRRKETADELMKRKINEEQQKEIKKINSESKKKLVPDPEDKKIKTKEKIKYILQKVKTRKKINRFNDIIEMD